MLIDENILLKYGAIVAEYEHGEEIFNEGGSPKYYFQIRTGIVELNNYDVDGKEFTQHILFKGQSIGESFLFADMPYTVNAIAKSACDIIKISKYSFLKLLDENPEISLKLFKLIAERLSDKYSMMFTLISQEPESKIKSILNYLKKNSNHDSPFTYEVPLTRKQIANLTGLRVETVIRTVKRMANNNKLKIRNRRIFC
ncbi:Crp/Fnr family transcriptional regulator [Chryseobacterium sp. 2R14A]|uniref:Crp/Fnr family transcriptional regulator n=1 Tax=Chryseobacterium sp. 2R14A TaxID=3380353 RepID=UPI003CEA66A3